MRRRQRVRVPWRLVASSAYEDVALAVYVKVAALAQRGRWGDVGCTAGTETLAGFLGMSRSSVERGLAQLHRPDPDGVVELTSRRRSKRGGDGDTAERRVREMEAGELYVWVPVAAAEDLTPRQLRAYAVIAYAVVRGLPLTEAQLAQFLRHHRGARAGQPVTVTAAGLVIDGVEAAGWVTVLRRGEQRGRHGFVAHDIPPGDRDQEEPEAAADPALKAVDNRSDLALKGTVSPQVGEGSGPQVGEGSLAYKEDHLTLVPDDARSGSSPAVGEVQVGEGVEIPAAAPKRAAAGGRGGLALRAGEEIPSSPSTSQTSRSTAALPYDGPQLTFSARIWAVLEPVHWLLERVDSVWLQRRIAREVGRQLRQDAEDARLRHRLTARLASTMVSDIRDPGRWILGVALPRWGCGHADCETGVMWSTGRPCPVCAGVVEDRRIAALRTWRREHGQCPEHGNRPDPEQDLDQPCPTCPTGAATLPTPQPAPQRSSAATGQARIAPTPPPSPERPEPAEDQELTGRPVDPTDGLRLRAEIAHRKGLIGNRHRRRKDPSAVSTVINASTMNGTGV